MNATFDQPQQLTNIWIDFATKVASAGMAFRPDTETPPEIAGHMRDASFTAMSQAADKFLRSEPFLAMMKQSLDASIGYRKRLNEFLTQAHHTVQGAAKADIDAMGLAVRHLEKRVLGRLEELCAGLERINERLDRLEAAPAQEKQTE